MTNNKINIGSSSSSISHHHRSKIPQRIRRRRRASTGEVFGKGLLRHTGLCQPRRNYSPSSVCDVATSFDEAFKRGTILPYFLDTAVKSFDFEFANSGDCDQLPALCSAYAANAAAALTTSTGSSSLLDQQKDQRDDPQQPQAGSIKLPRSRSLVELMIHEQHDEGVEIEHHNSFIDGSDDTDEASDADENDTYHSEGEQQQPHQLPLHHHHSKEQEHNDYSPSFFSSSPVRSGASSSSLSPTSSPSPSSSLYESYYDSIRVVADYEAAVDATDTTTDAAATVEACPLSPPPPPPPDLDLDDANSSSDVTNERILQRHQRRLLQHHHNNNCRSPPGTTTIATTTTTQTTGAIPIQQQQQQQQQYEEYERRWRGYHPLVPWTMGGAAAAAANTDATSSDASSGGSGPPPPPDNKAAGRALSSSSQSSNKSTGSTGRVNSSGDLNKEVKKAEVKKERGSTQNPNPTHPPPLERVQVQNPGADRSALKELPALRDAPPTKREELFILKLKLCSVIFSFEDPMADKRGKDMKRQTLLELVDYVNTPAGQKIFTESVMGDLMRMVSSNVCRALPPATDDFDPEEDEPVLEPAWPHLQVAYEFFLRFIVSSEVNAKAAKKFVDQKFCLQLVELFDSEDPRERDYLKTILHRIYGKFMSHRSFIRRAISNVFYRFVYETERHNGIGELLEILGSIINGFAIPLKKEHLQFLVRALIPLHKPKCVALYHQQLSYCIIQYVEKDADTATPILNGFFKCWPWSSSGKQVMFLNELEEILELLGADQLAQVSDMLFTNLARCLDSDHFQVVERALFLWNNEHLVNSGCLSRLNAQAVLPIIYGPLYKNSSGHWNATVEGLAQNVLKMYMEYDLVLYDRCTANYFRDEEEAKQKLQALEERWSAIEQTASTNVPAICVK